MKSLSSALRQFLYDTFGGYRQRLHREFIREVKGERQ
jgi:hypothetical protein